MNEINFLSYDVANGTLIATETKQYVFDCKNDIVTRLYPNLAAESFPFYEHKLVSQLCDQGACAMHIGFIAEVLKQLPVS